MSDKNKKKRDVGNFIFLIPIVGLVLYIVYGQDYRNQKRTADISLLRVVILSIIIPVAVFLGFLMIAIAAV